MADTNPWWVAAIAAPITLVTSWIVARIGAGSAIRSKQLEISAQTEKAEQEHQDKQQERLDTLSRDFEKLSRESSQAYLQFQSELNRVGAELITVRNENASLREREVTLSRQRDQFLSERDEAYKVIAEMRSDMEIQSRLVIALQQELSALKQVVELHHSEVVHAETGG